MKRKNKNIQISISNLTPEMGMSYTALRNRITGVTPWKGGEAHRFAEEVVTLANNYLKGTGYSVQAKKDAL